MAKKPAPDTVYAALKELGMPKEGAVYVGDSEVDVMTAKIPVCRAFPSCGDSGRKRS